MARRMALYLLGTPRIELDGAPVRLGRRKATALLAYLAVSGEVQRRDSLVALLWPEFDTARGLPALRRTLYALKRALPGDWLDADREEIGLQPVPVAGSGTSEALWVDVVAFRQKLSAWENHGHTAAETCPACAQPLTEAVALVHGDFMSGFGLRDSASFDDWQLFQAEQLRRELDEALRKLVRWHSARREFDLATRYARRRLALDVLDEGAHRQLMRLYAWSGRRSAALGQFAECSSVLNDQLGVPPQEVTAALFRSIQEGHVPPLPGFEDVLQAEPACAGDGGYAMATPGAQPVAGTAALPPFLEAPQRWRDEDAERPVFVARERELASLEAHLEAVMAGQGRVVFVTGDAGSGKTALIEELGGRAQANHEDLVVAGGQGNAQTGIGDPYLPFREILGRLTGDVEAQWAAGAMTREQAVRLWHTLPHTGEALAKYGPELIDTFVQRAALLRRARAYTQGPVPWLARLERGADVRPDTGPGISAPLQTDLLEQYARVLEALAQRRPLMLVVDDLQWADLGTISLLFHLGREVRGCRILIVGAYRPEEVALGRDGKRHPLEPVVHELQRAYGDILASLGSAESRDFVDAYLDSEPNRLGEPFRDMLFRQTRGHPLFTIELLRGLQEQGDLVRDPSGAWVEGQALDWERLPARVEAVIAERVGRLSEPLRAALQVASVEGESFTAEVVARVQGASEREVMVLLGRDLDKTHRLVRAQGIQRLDGQRLSQYRFRHILFQRFLYSSLNEVERVYLHEAVAGTLETMYQGQAGATSAISGQLAWHYELAGMPAQAMRFSRDAGERALRLCAYQEAIAHLTRGLALFEALPVPGDEAGLRARRETELAMQVSLGKAWLGLGFFGPEATAAFARARHLSQQAGMAAQLSNVLGGMAVVHYVKPDPRRARELGAEALAMAERAGDPVLVALARWYQGVASFALGEYSVGLSQLARVVDFYDPPSHHQAMLNLRGVDGGASAIAYYACVLWCLGYPDQACDVAEKVLVLAHEQGHAFSLADVVCFAGCMLSRMCRDAGALKEHSAELIAIATEHGVPGWYPAGAYYQGEALVMLGQPRQGIDLIHRGIETSRERNVQLHKAGLLSTLALAQAEIGNPAEALEALDQALAWVEHTGERHWEVEVHQTRAEVLLGLGEEQAAEAELHKAIDVARRQQAKSWELQATTRLARLWRMQGRGGDARARLAEVYGWFSEGFGTPDLVAARGLLEELGWEGAVE